MARSVDERTRTISGAREGNAGAGGPLERAAILPLNVFATLQAPTQRRPGARHGRLGFGLARERQLAAWARQRGHILCVCVASRSAEACALGIGSEGGENPSENLEVGCGNHTRHEVREV